MIYISANLFDMPICQYVANLCNYSINTELMLRMGALSITMKVITTNKEDDEEEEKMKNIFIRVLSVRRCNFFHFLFLLPRNERKNLKIE